MRVIDSIRRFGVLGLVGVIGVPGTDVSADTPRSAAPEGAELYFISPRDGEVVGTTFTVKFGLRGMGVAPAGVDRPDTGHHHLLIDLDGDVEVDQPLPADEQVRHFGGGQTEAEVTLPPGEHRLQLMLGNFLHIPHDPPVVSEMITIAVEGPGQSAEGR